MKSLFTLVLICALTNLSLAQPIKEMNPEIGWTPDLSAKAQEEWRRRDELMAKESLTPAEKKELEKLMPGYSEVMESIWDIIGGACSWYCGEGPYEVVASSNLPKQGNNEYTGRKAHDLSFKTAWVEGANGPGIGEYIEYHFRNKGPRVTEIKIFNGYVKSDKAWTENARVKKLKLSINGKDVAMLNLQDSKAQQNFKFEPLGRRADGKDLILRFTIAEVYPGSKFDDTCITEIYFDGIDVHCFAKGTSIFVNRNRQKNIEDVVPGDSVLVFDAAEQKFVTDIVEDTEAVRHRNLVKYTFEDGSSITATQDHPFLVDEKGWSSFNPKKTGAYVGFQDVRQIEISDQFIRYETTGKAKLISLRAVEIVKDEQETYTISKLKSGRSFIANGLIVGVEEVLNLE